MRNRAFLAALSVLAMPITSTDAQVRYDFQAFSTPAQGAFSESFTGSFSYVSPTYLTSAVTVAPGSLASCAIVGSVFGSIPCNSQTLDGLAIGSDLVRFRGSSPSLGVVDFSYLFDDGALLAPGVYNSTNPQRDLRARLTVTDLNAAAVPEPATWGMMIAGFGMLGAAMRRRRYGVMARFA